jgi:hypothetical protein
VTGTYKTLAAALKRARELNQNPSLHAEAFPID